MVSIDEALSELFLSLFLSLSLLYIPSHPPHLSSTLLTPDQTTLCIIPTLALAFDFTSIIRYFFTLTVSLFSY
jgi:hypothetical protein